MDDETDNIRDEGANREIGDPAPKEYSEALLAAAIERLKARGDSVKRFGCMQLPPALFRDLCGRLLERQRSVRATADWLAGQTADAPGRSSVERFSDVLFEEYRLVTLARTREQAASYVTAATAGDPDAMQMALNTRLTELLTDELLRAGDSGEIETKRLMALMIGSRAVAQTAFDKQKMDARNAALETLNKKMQAELVLKDFKIKEAVAVAGEIAKKGGSGEAINAALKEVLGL